MAPIDLSHTIEHGVVTYKGLSADTRGMDRPVHTVPLGAGILIHEHMTNLAALPDAGFAFDATPPKVKGFGTFPFGPSR